MKKIDDNNNNNSSNLIYGIQTAGNKLRVAIKIIFFVYSSNSN